MRHASTIATQFIPAKSDSRAKRIWKAVRTNILHTFHQTRHLQAMQILRDYRELIDQAEHGEPKLYFREGQHDERSDETKGRLASLRRMLVAGMLIMFLMLHVGAAVALQRAGEWNGATSGDTTSQSYD